MSVSDQAARFANPVDQRMWSERIPAAWWIFGLILLLLPIVANNFWLFQIMGWTFILGMIGLSLMFLAGYGGMVSLLQMSIAGMAGYMVAILGPSGAANVSLGLSWWIVLPAAFLIAALFATVCGALAVRTDGIYTIMITLAIAAAFFYFTRQNYSIFNGYSGFNLVLPPKLFGVNWRDPLPFYYLSLGCAALCYGAVVYLARAPFAGVIAAVAGILLVWQNAPIAPGTIGISSAIDVLVVAVVGGMRRPLGPFIGAFIYVLLQVFSTDILGFFGFSADRFKLIIGIGFLAIVLFSPDGVLGLWDRWRAGVAARQAATKGGGA